jgi:quercetin dioxygenase-like cupin family protein
LNKDLQFFLEPAHERTDVVFCAKAQRRRIDPPDVKFSIELLTEGLSDQKVSTLLVRVPPRGRRTHVRHQGEEFQYCLRGTVAFTVNGKQYRLMPGDALHFKCDVAHSWTNVGAEEAERLMICSPPLHVARSAEDP